MTIRLTYLVLIIFTCLAACSCENPPAPTSQANATANENKQSSTNATPAANRPVTESAYKVEWVDKQIPATMSAGKEQNVMVTLKNLSDESWPSKAIAISYHFYKEDKMVDKYDGARTSLPHDIAPGEQFTVNSVRVVAPKVPGAYQLQITLVHENVAWFEGKGAKTLLVPVKVL